MKNSKFIPLYETIYNRYKQGAGFLEGDIVKLKSGYKSLDCYKNLSDSVKAHLEGAEKSGYNLRVGRLHTPDNQYGSMGYINLPATHADLYQEKSPGNFGGLVTIPIELIEVLDTGVNLASVSDNNKRANGQYQKAGKWKSNPDTEETKEQNHLGHEENWVKKGDYDLATKNKKSVVGANSYNDEKPSEFKPLPKNGKKPKTLKESEEILNELYVHILREDDSEAERAEESTEETTETPVEEKICPICGMDVCQCKKEEGAGVMHFKDQQAKAAGKDTFELGGKSFPVKEEEEVYDESDLKHHVKDECWNMEDNRLVDECWEEDGSVKEECWKMAEEEAAMPENDPAAQDNNAKDPEQTSAL